MLRLLTLTIACVATLACVPASDAGPPGGPVVRGGAPPATQESLGASLDEPRTVR